MFDVVKFQDRNLEFAVRKAVAAPPGEKGIIERVAELLKGGVAANSAKKLKVLRADCCGLWSLWGVEHLTELTHLSVNSYVVGGGGRSPIAAAGVPYTPNQISDIMPLRYLSHLTVFAAQCNRITDISPMRHLSNLVVLQLDGNDIRDISPLQDLRQLERLFLSHNRITDVTPLRNMRNLRELHLDFNQISDLTTLLDLPSLELLAIAGNPLNPLSMETYLALLLAKGTTIDGLF